VPTVALLLGSATPLASVTVPAAVPVPEQVVLPENTVKETVPVGVPAVPVTVALSCTVVPLATEVTTACDGSWMLVATVGVSLVAASGSQGPSASL